MTGSVPEVSLRHPDEKLEIGDLLVRADSAGSAPEAVVLDATEDGSRLLLMALPDGTPTEVLAADAGAWKKAPPPQARLVEVYEIGAPAPFFAAYVPDIQAAIAIYRAFEARDGDFRVEIYANDEQEQEMLDGIGYYGAEEE